MLAGAGGCGRLFWETFRCALKTPVGTFPQKPTAGATASVFPKLIFWWHSPFGRVSRNTRPLASAHPQRADSSVLSPWHILAAGVAGFAGSGTGHIACRGPCAREGQSPGYAARHPRYPRIPASVGGCRRVWTRRRRAVSWSLSVATGRRRQYSETARVDELPRVIKQGAGIEQDVLE